MTIVRFLLADITAQTTQAIVNSAHMTLAPMGGVTGAIHKVAGPKLAEECAAALAHRHMRTIKEGEYVVTQGYNLLARHVIHVRAPLWHDGTHNEDRLLRLCYQEALSACQAWGDRTVAFPALSVGIFMYPAAQAAYEAARATLGWIKSHPSGLDEVRFCFLDPELRQTFRDAFEKELGGASEPVLL